MLEMHTEVAPKSVGSVGTIPSVTIRIRKRERIDLCSSDKNRNMKMGAASWNVEDFGKLKSTVLKLDVVDSRTEYRCLPGIDRAVGILN